MAVIAEASAEVFTDTSHAEFTEQSHSEISPERGPPLVSVIVTCKGRLHHLRETLPTLLGQACGFRFEVIVVDYGCPQETFSWCTALNDSRLVALCVEDNVELFRLARARNCGASVALGKILAFADADMRLEKSWLECATAAIRSGVAGLVCVGDSGPTEGWDRCGTCVVLAKVFHRVSGYDESFEGWGPEDSDFYERCRLVATMASYPAHLVHPIRHGDEERVRFYAIHDKGISAAEIERRRVDLKRVVNPMGHGKGVFKIERGQRMRTFNGWQPLSRIRPTLRLRTSIEEPVVVPERWFSHSGDLGDIIYSLPAVRAAGGGILYLYDCPGRTAHGMTAERADRIRPLLIQQPYIADVIFKPDAADHPLNRFRDHGHSGNLADMHLAALGHSWVERERAWLDVDRPDSRYPVIIARSGRYQNEHFPWKRVVEKYGDDAGFIGFPQEHQAFCNAFGNVAYAPADNLLEVARLIAGCKLFVGNFSCPAAIAEGFKKHTILEVCPWCPQLSSFHRWNCLLGFDHRVELLDLHEIMPSIHS